MEEPIGLIVSNIGDALGVNKMALELAIIMIGAVFLAISFYLSKDQKSRYYAAVGWIFIGVYFYLQSDH